MRKKIAMLFAMFFLVATQSIGNNEIPTFNDRDEISEKYKWDLAPIYQSWEEWEIDKEKLKVIYDDIMDMQGKLGESSESLVRYLAKQEETGTIGIKLYCYVYLLRSMDTRNC